MGVEGAEVWLAGVRGAAEAAVRTSWLIVDDVEIIRAVVYVERWKLNSRELLLLAVTAVAVGLVVSVDYESTLGML